MARDNPSRHDAMLTDFAAFAAEHNAKRAEQMKGWTPPEFAEPTAADYANDAADIAYFHAVQR